MSTAVRAFGLALSWILGQSAIGQDVLRSHFGSEESSQSGLLAGPMSGDVDADRIPDLWVHEFQGGNATLAALSGATLDVVWQVTIDPWWISRVVAAIGDVTGDGIPDLALVGLDSHGQLAIVVRSGRDGAIDRVFSKQGDLLAGLGDVNHDGIPDLGVARIGSGEGLVLSGKDGAQIWKVSGLSSIVDLSSAGDVDRDGVPDLLVAMKDAVNLLSGGSGATILSISKSSLGNASSFASADGSGDLNGDGQGDIVIGGWVKTSPFQHVWGISGKDGTLLYENGPTSGSDLWGVKVRSVGDVDGDGIPDFLDGGDGSPMHLLSGASGIAIDRYAPVQADLAFGTAFGGCGDLTGDGRAEIFIADGYYTTLHATNAGALLIYDRYATDPASGVNARIVDAHGSGNFATIQDAVNASADGDLILVRPSVYDGFAMSKRVLLKPTSLPFCVAGAVSLTGIQPGNDPAGIDGMIATVDRLDVGNVELSQCPGEVTLEQVRCSLRLNLDPSHFVITGCPNVGLTECVAGKRASDSTNPATPGMTIDASMVRTTDLQADGEINALSDSTAAITATQSTVVLARPRVTGGRGDDGRCGYGYGYGNQPATNGGPGIVADASSIVVLGTEAEFIRGGPGGIGNCGPGGNGGDGIVLVNQANVTISRVQLAGGVGGGSGASDGVDHSGQGTFTRDDRLVHLALAGALEIDASTQLTIDSVETGAVLLIASTVGGFRTIRSVVGPPLSVLPGPGFQVIPLGPTDGAGDLFLNGTIPNDLGLVGLQLELQSIVFAASGTLYLSNAASSTIGL